MSLSSILSGISALSRLGTSQAVTLGAISLSGVEVPDVLEVAGNQALAIYKLPGGGQIVQAMGDNPADIPLAGLFTGSDAAARAMAVEAMRTAGVAVTFAAPGRRFSVLVSSFSYRYEQQGAIVRYTLGLKVLPSVQMSTLGVGSALADLVGPGVAGAIISVTSAAASVAAYAASAINVTQGVMAQVGPVASMIGLGTPFARAGDLLTQAQGITGAGINLAQAPAAAASVIGDLQGAASSLGGIIGTSSTALGQISAAAPVGSLVPADPAQAVAAIGLTLAQASALQGVASVNTASIGAQIASGSAVNYPAGPSALAA